MGNYHPHGDSAIYEALVRMAQSFALRVSARRRLRQLRLARRRPRRGDALHRVPPRDASATELLTEIDQDTVQLRPNYDGTKREPVVLPAKLPNLLINGATGIAVGMATNIPPHNPEEVCAAPIRLLDALTRGQGALVARALPHHQGPGLSDRRADRLHAGGDQADLRDGAGHAQGPRHVGARRRRHARTKTIFITSIPYAVNKSVLVERIADVVLARKMPLLLDVKDVSTDDVRIELELKKEADEQKVLAYLFKNTPLQTNFAVNLTCLVPDGEPGGRPPRAPRSAGDALALPRTSASTSSRAPRSTSSTSSRSACTSSKASRRSSTRSIRS